MNRLDKAFKEFDVMIARQGKEQSEAIKALDTVLASYIKTEDRKQRMLRNRLINL